MVFKLWQLFKAIPLPFLIIYLSFVCVALPVHSTELTPDNFEDSVANGVWFIEHFSPYCAHCRAFAPTWEELVQKNEPGSAEATGVRLAQINCAVHGDLCEAHGVKGYPEMNIYKDGVFVETFKGARDSERLTEFIKRHAPPPPPEAELQELEPETLASSANFNPSGDVLVLDESNFQSSMAEGPTFVKFYAPWCGHCKKLAPIWKNLARSMQYKLNIAEVDCEAHKSLCKEHNIQGFPTLMFIADGSETEYNGGRRIEHLREFADKASRAGAKPISVNELEKYVTEESLVYVLVYPSSERNLLSALRPLFAPLLGSPSVYAVADPPFSLWSQFSIPSTSTWALVAFKDHDITAPSGLYSSSVSSTSLRHNDTQNNQIKSWLFRNRLPTTTELTQDTFQSVMNSPARPLVVLAAVTSSNKDRVQQRMEEIGKIWRAATAGTGMLSGKGKSEERPVVFAWMDIERWKDWMKSMYGIKNKGFLELDDVDVVIADHQALVYYDTDSAGSPIKLNSHSISATLDGIAQELLLPKNSENFIERVARYLNNKLQSIESYIFNNPKYIALLFIVGLLVITFAIRKALTDDPTDSDYMRVGKSKADRLD
ncbi:protein disulfide isomerase [Rhodocollybia butyracea]|uniref:Protein disulfide isomerase n=1 Tax=Rhodocollybia butyracea TaxID=206335 RepID=A0A9P5Q9F2_9AGAR|nr:protein disulfide isomerase [Rhodocollybia butyracea]